VACHPSHPKLQITIKIQKAGALEHGISDPWWLRRGIFNIPMLNVVSLFFKVQNYTPSMLHTLTF